MIDHDILMACDECDAVGLKEIMASHNVQTDWHLCDDGTVLCGYCNSQNV